MDMSTFAKEHVSQITATIGLVTFAIVKNKLTPAGIVAGIFVAFIHMLHPWPAFFWLLILFFFFGTVVTKIGHEAKAHLTLSSTGGSGGEGPRSYVQVFANSGLACILIALHAYLLNSTPFISSQLGIAAGPHFPALTKLLPIGIVAQYAAVAADTFSSELGILSKQQPFMVTAPWKKVPKGTNGGITIDGLKYGALGSSMLTFVASLALYLLPPHGQMNPRASILLIVAGLAGSVIDSVLGALVQATVVDKGTGKVVEGAGGQRVKVLQGGSRAQVGIDLLTNNGVNFVMAALASVLAMGAAHVLEVRLTEERHPTKQYRAKPNPPANHHHHSSIKRRSTVSACASGSE
ncbi:unnamed protein product [Zymoseptoria tritici ST99CH_1E4]|uniref:DUF92 domain-containing protein n=1 Tax=Zymoseptoria tritici ST99CH_1E4 TaxID=1276532 RepID=A0A2H1GYR2_ZYMTR|nr:unnamed protein product [Zymoseptoria tritici ST99CH_1E4]